jgi:endogenous inhibitor of DNA gyrase (YacG/DUF329 family)
MTQGRDTLLCPECGQWVPHNRGFLNEHSKDIKRGELVTGSTFCDGSNTKPKANLKTVIFTGLCTNCVSSVRREFRETFPGSLDQYGGTMTVNCPECGEEGDYCSMCEHKLHKLDGKAADIHIDSKYGDIQAEIVDLMGAIQNLGADPVATMEKIVALQAQLPANLDQATPSEVWLNDLGETECPDGQLHTNVHRPQENRPVLLTDNHVIVVPATDD